MDLKQSEIINLDAPQKLYDEARVKDGHTMVPIRFDWGQLEAATDPAIFLKSLLGQVSENMLLRYRYFESLRSKKSRWLKRVNYIKVICLMFGTILAFIGSSIKFIENDYIGKMDLWILMLSGLNYTLVAALILFDKASGLSASYFRCIATSLAIRDVMREYNFKMMREMVLFSNKGIDKKTEWLEISEECSGKIDALSSKEHFEWKEAFQASQKIAETGSKNKP